jgi:NADPH-dependent 2,4-dienoyl-CoA reductase/sulfur reductase-like enzyme/nitrite reductase/ring-hydroxylating ferredoxin subunit
MADDTPTGPDLAQGVAAEALTDRLLGHVAGQPVLLLRDGGEVFAIDALCTHYHGPLAEGIVVDGGVRCPWHHACFDIRSGEALRAPATAPLACWNVAQKDGYIFVGEKRAPRKHAAPVAPPGAIVIVGGGAAGYAAAEMLRRLAYAGHIVMLSADADPPVDRPNLSKDYLAGSAPEDWMPLQPDTYYKENGIDLRLGVEVTAIDTRARKVTTADGAAFGYDRLLLATGAEPVRLDIPGAERGHVHTLRSFADCRAIIADAKTAKKAVVIGASFIGLEVAASLRARKIEVHVVAPEKRPMERVLGAAMGDFIRGLHEEHGVIFHLENTVSLIGEKSVTLKGGAVLDADLVVVGVGVRPRLALAEKAGLALDRGVQVDEYLETSAPGVYAAGDIARWPDPHSGANIRVEHWAVAERQGQIAAHNMLGLKRKFDAVPFFWSQHYDVPVNYVGHAEKWDEIAVEGDIAGRDCLLHYRSKGRDLAVASIYRDQASLEVEARMEHNAKTGDQARL